MTTERQVQQRKAASDARNAAVKRLKALHKDEYRALYNEEARKRGVSPQGARRQQRIERLERELAALREKES